MTHAELTTRAIHWLKNSQRCPLVLSEMYSQAGFTLETPDAIGFRGKISILVECKASIKDFRKDKYKLWRRDPQRGIGVYRYYLTPRDLLQGVALPKKWGLLEVRGKIIRKVVEAQAFNFMLTAYLEKPLLISAAVWKKAI